MNRGATANFWSLTLADWLAVAGLAVGVAGFAITIWQLFRTANASIATRKAVERTEKRMAVSHLLVLLPQFRLIESDLDTAVIRNDHPLAVRSLVAYYHFASEVAGILSKQPNVDPELIAKLKSSARSASHSKGVLIDEPNKAAKTATKGFRDELGEVATYVGELASMFSVTAG